MPENPDEDTTSPEDNLNSNVVEKDIDVDELLTQRRWNDSSREDKDNWELLMKLKKRYETDVTEAEIDQIKTDYKMIEELLSHNENPIDAYDSLESQYTKILIQEQQHDFGSRSDESQSKEIRDKLSSLLKNNGETV